jgi:hypothetical protein
MKTGKVNFWEIDDSGSGLRHGDVPVSELVVAQDAKFCDRRGTERGA